MGHKNKIHTMNDTEIELRQMPLLQAWQLFKTIIPTANHNYNQTRFGIYIQFDINKYLKGELHRKPKSGITIIRGKSYNDEDIETEIELRERIIKEYLVNEYQQEDITISR